MITSYQSQLVFNQMPEFSFIIPVYNRPQEVDELLTSLTKLEGEDFEVIVVDDGSEKPCSQIVGNYSSKLPVIYHSKENTGPGLTRNFGAEKSTGSYLIFLDSDCLVPREYLNEIKQSIKSEKLDAFGGPDRALPSFTNLQKAINYSMTSFITTGGIRGGKKQMENYKPRSFNMGIKRDVFDDLKGFREMRFGEDIDLSIRLEKKGYKSILIDNAYVYHRRRSSIAQFYKQVYNSGMARIVLGQLHPGSTKLVHFLPAVFVLMVILSIGLTFLNWLFALPLALLFAIILINSAFINKSIFIGALSVVTSFTQLIGYGLGFSWGFVNANILGKKPAFGFEESFYN